MHTFYSLCFLPRMFLPPACTDTVLNQAKQICTNDEIKGIFDITSGSKGLRTNIHMNVYTESDFVICLMYLCT